MPNLIVLFKRQEHTYGDRPVKPGFSCPAFTGHSKSSKVARFARPTRHSTWSFHDQHHKTDAATAKRKGGGYHDFLLVIQSSCGPISRRFCDKRRFRSNYTRLSPTYLSRTQRCHRGCSSNFDFRQIWINGFGLKKNLDWWPSLPAGLERLTMYGLVTTRYHNVTQRTDGQTLWISHSACYCMLTRNKNDWFTLGPKFVALMIAINSKQCSQLLSLMFFSCFNRNAMLSVEQ